MSQGDASGVWLARGLGLFYGLAGVLHLMHPAPFVAITPDFVPEPNGSSG